MLPRFLSYKKLGYKKGVVGDDWKWWTWNKRTHFQCPQLLAPNWQGRRSVWDRGDTSPNIWTGGHDHECPPNISRVISATFYPCNIFLISWKSFLLFLPLYALAMERSCRRLASVRPSVCPSVRLSVTLVSTDHIRRARWNFITRLISRMSSFAARQISAI